MPSFTIESTYRLPMFRHRTYDAPTLADACRLAIDDEDWFNQKEDYESAGPTYLTGVWPGNDTAYCVPALAIPPEFAHEGGPPGLPVEDLPKHYVVGIAFLSGVMVFATEEFTVDVTNIEWAEAEALQLAQRSVYFDLRVPDLACAIYYSAEVLSSPGNPLLDRAVETLASCLYDLDARVAQGPVGNAPEEQRRRDGYEAVLNQLSAQRQPSKRVLHRRFDSEYYRPVYGAPAPGPLDSFSVLVTIYSGEEAIAQEIYTLEAPNAIQAENFAIDRSDDSPDWRSSFEDMSRSAVALEGKPLSLPF